MLRSNRELWWALLAVVTITAAYLGVTYAWQEVPPSSELFGHLIGVAGFILMIMTETLYSIRKRSHRARWGRMASWLRFHIFTGIVGPYMVLLHSAWNFQGLAGISLLLTVLIVLSGFIGRYIYTSVPRNVDGAEMESSQIQAQMAALQTELQVRMQAQPELAQVMPVVDREAAPGVGLIFGRAWIDWQQRRRWNQASRIISPELREQAGQLEALALRQQELRRQEASLATARRWLGLWHAVHIPLGFVLFTTAVIHSAAAFYYATLLQ
ncbi:MAG: hypothetical protein H6Q38_1348 [Chloroflexi bacterium]|nr:hypothetical protein [Chloroflexota bacterium]